MYKSESSLIWAKLNYIWVYCKRSSVFLIMFCNMICPLDGMYKKNIANHATGNIFRLWSFFELSYLDSNQDKQNQNLLCYHYTIGQSSVLPFGKAVQN